MKHVLVVDDELDILETIIDTLEFEFSNSVRFDRAGNGAEALRLFQKKAYDLVITDLNMPEMNGIDFSKQVKRLNKDIPVIVFTGHGDSEEYSMLKDVGIQSMIKKPFVEKLVAAVNEYI